MERSRPERSRTKETLHTRGEDEAAASDEVDDRPVAGFRGGEFLVGHVEAGVGDDSDMVCVIGWANTYLDLPRPDSITLVGTIFQSIGLGLPSAAGAARARPDDTIVVVLGDGGGLMGLPDLDSLIRTADSAMVLIFDDAAYGAEVHQYGSQGLSQSIMQIDEVDFAATARGLGAASAAVETLEDLAELEVWINNGARGTFVVDLRVSQQVIAPYIQEIIELTLKR